MIQITEHYESMFNTEVKVPAGFKMTFENGNTISVQWGSGNYCTDRDKSQRETLTAEIAIWDKDNRWHNFGNDQVKGWCGADEVAKWIHFAANNTVVE